MSGMDERKPEIDYPTHWEYRLIGRDAAALRAAAEEAADGDEHEVRFARMSAKGSYVSLTFVLRVRDEAHRKGVFERLANHESVVHLI